MATLAGNTIASTYPLLLKIDSNGIDGTLRAIEDGDGTDSAVKISTSAMQVTGDVSIISASSASPTLLVKNTNDDGEPAYCQFIKDTSNSAADNDEIVKMEFYHDNDANSLIRYGSMIVSTTDVSNGSEDSNIRFNTRAAGADTTTLTLVSGKVGIGENVPLAMLHIKEGDSGIPEPLNSSGTNLFLEAASSNAAGMTMASGNTANGFIIFGDGDSNFQGAIQYDHAQADNSTSKMHLTTVGSQRVTIDANGKVGIGTTAPDTLLNLKSASGVELRIEADSDNSGQEDCFIRFYTDGKTQEGVCGMDNNNSSTLFTTNTENAMVFGCVSNLPVVFATNSTERMQIQADGAVKIVQDTLSTTGSHTAFSVSTIKTAGDTDSSDTFMGYRNHLEFADGDENWGSMYGLFNLTQVSAASSTDSSQVLASYDKVSLEAGDVDNVFGAYTEAFCDGGAVDTNVYGQQTFVNIDSGVTLSNAVYGHHLKIDGDVNPADAYYGLVISQQGGQMHGSDDFFFLCFDDQNDDKVAQITALAGVATFDSGDFSGAPDYAEYFESKDGNKIAPGTTVKLDGDKVVPCEDGNTPIGVVRPDGTSAIVGNAKTLGYTDKYLKTDYDEIIMEDYKLVQWVEEIDLATYRANRQDTKPVLGGNTRYYIEEGTDEAITTKYFRKHSYHSDRLPSGVTVPSDATTQTPNHQRKKLNPDYDPSLADDYKGRATRDEWCLVGLLGQIPITKGQPLASNWIKMRDVSDTVELYFVK